MEEWSSLVRVVVLLSLVPALWFGVIPIEHPILSTAIVLIGGYVIFLAVGNRSLPVLQKPDLIIAMDLLVITLLVMISGELNSPFIYLYYLTILEAAARINLREALAASLAMAAMLFFLWFRAGYAATLETLGFRLGALIAGGFLLALILGLMLQDYRAAQSRMQGLQFASNLATRLSGELRVEGVLDILLEIFLEIFHLERVAAYVYSETGELQFAASRGAGWGRDLSPEALPLSSLPTDAPAGEIIIRASGVHASGIRDPRSTRSFVCVPLVRAGQLRAWLCGLGQVPESLPDSLRSLAQGVAAQGVTALEAAWAHQRMSELASTDVLTALANRRSFLDRLTAVLASGRRTGRPFSVALIDLDGFKAINDSLGHSAGDRIIVEFAKFLTRSIRGSDVAARFGGDEFALLFPETPRSVVQNVLRRMRSRWASMSDQAGHPPLRFSWGIAAWPVDGDAPEALLQVADHRLYAMKRRRGAEESGMNPAARGQG